MKKIMAFVLVIMLVLFVTACGKTTAPAEEAEKSAETSEKELASVEENIADIESLEDELDFSELDSLDEELNFDI